MWEDEIWRGWNWAGYKKGKRMASFFAESLGRVASAGLIIGGTITSAKLKAVIRQLKAYQPQHCYVYPNVAYIIAKYLLEQNDVSINVESIITTGEQLFDWERDAIEEAFQCKVFNEWGSNDGANTAHECSEHIGLHHAAERNIIEIVDGRIIATDLWNYALPFIRYENGDAGKWLDECPCGRKLPLIEIYGRFNDFLITPTGFIFPRVIAGPISNLAIGIDSYQIIQKSMEHIELKVVKDGHFSDIEFQNALVKMKEILKEIDIKVSFVKKIPLTVTGKRKFIINETNIDVVGYIKEF
jgi:phenylacetate-CoA ligase